MSDTVSALISTGTNTTTFIVNPASETSGTIPVSTAGIGTNALVLYNWNPATQLSHFLAAEALVTAGVTGARVKIVTMGDSTTAGFGGATADYRNTVSYPTQIALSLTSDGINAQYDNFLGGYTDYDGRVALIGTAEWNGVLAAGGQAIDTKAAGDGVNFTLSKPANYDRVDINYIDSNNATISVSVDGEPVIATFQTGNTGKMLTQTIDIPPGMHSEVSIRAATANSAWIEGAAFWNSTKPSVEIYNAGVPGAASDTVNNLTTSGNGEIQGVAALKPNLVFIDYGINDINTNIANGFETLAQLVSNIGLMVTTLRAAGSDVIIVIPQPFNSTNYSTLLPQYRTAVEALATADNVPVIDLSATYNNDYNGLVSAGLMFDNLHPDATLYADIGSNIAALLTSAITQAAACFAAGTRISTARGKIAVENLVLGDMVITASGARSPILWIGKRWLALNKHPHPEKVQPICITAHAIVQNIPVRDLIVSPDHALYLGGHLIPAKALLNGFTIRQLKRRSVTYYHVELARHSIIRAENTLVETYLDSGNRCAFENAGAALFLHPDFAQAQRASGSCAPFAEAGPVVEAVRWQILQRAGIETTNDPGLKIIYRRGAAIISSRHCIPGELGKDPRDRRRLGVKIARLEIDGIAIPLDHPALTQGWHGLEADGRWTNGYAVIPEVLINGSYTVRLKLAAALSYPTAAIARFATG